MIPQTHLIKLRSENLKSKMGQLQQQSTISKIVQKLHDQEYRKAFVASQINIGIPFQIRSLMKSRGWTQEKLAERTGMLQPRISAMLKPGKVRPNIETLRRIAEAFDCGLLVRFEPFSDLAHWSDSFDPEKFNVPAFDEDPGFKEPAQEEHPEEAAVAKTGTLPALASLGGPNDLSWLGNSLEVAGATSKARWGVIQQQYGSIMKNLSGNAPLFQPEASERSEQPIQLSVADIITANDATSISLASGQVAQPPKRDNVVVFPGRRIKRERNRLKRRSELSHRTSVSRRLGNG